MNLKGSHLFILVIITYTCYYIYNNHYDPWLFLVMYFLTAIIGIISFSCTSYKDCDLRVYGKEADDIKRYIELGWSDALITDKIEDYSTFLTYFKYSGNIFVIISILPFALIEFSLVYAFKFLNI